MKAGKYLALRRNDEVPSRILFAREVVDVHPLSNCIILRGEPCFEVFRPYSLDRNGLKMESDKQGALA